MATRRQRKVAELLHEEISGLIQRETRDPRLGFVTITGVDVSPDLRYARVYFTTLDQSTVAETQAGLASASGYFRHKLGQTLSLRYIPELTFKLDTSLEQGMRIESLLESVKADWESGENLDETESD